MARTVTEILETLELEQLGADRFRGRPPRATELEKLYGGHVISQALMAAGRTVAADRPVHSVHGQFLRSSDTRTPVDYHVEILRDGRSFSSRRVVAYQHGRATFHLSASFHVAESGFEHQEVAPDVGSVAEAPLLADVMEQQVGAEIADMWRREWEALDMRYAVDPRPLEQRVIPPSVQRVWIRTRGEIPADPLSRAGLIAYLSDLGLLAASLVPHGYTVWAPDIPRATLDHSVWFHQCGFEDGWLLFDQTSSWAGRARGLSTAKVFDASGAMLASLAQEGLIRPHGALIGSRPAARADCSSR